MKVTHFSAAHEGTGAANAATRIHRECLRLGMRSRMWVTQSGSDEPEVGLLRRRAGLAGRLCERVERAWETHLLTGVQARADYVLSTGRFGHDAARVARAAAPDLVQLHWIAGGSFQLSRIAGISKPIVWRLPDMWPFCGVEHLMEDSRRFVEGYSPANRPTDLAGWDVSAWAWENKRRTYARLRNLTIVTPSRWLADCARRSALFRNRKVVVIKTGCDTEVFQPRDQAACRTVLDMPADRRIILAGATCMKTRWKGGDLLVEAVNQLVATGNTPFELVIFGRGGEAVQERVKCPVRCFGTVKSERLMAALYAAADVFVAPSRMENMANTVLEAMACGTPCAAFEIGGMPDMIEHGVSGWLAKPFDTNELAAGLRAVLANPTSERRAAARRRIERDFTVAEQGRQYQALYASLLERPAA